MSWNPRIDAPMFRAPVERQAREIDDVPPLHVPSAEDIGNAARWRARANYLDSTGFAPSTATILRQRADEVDPDGLGR